MPRHDSGNYMSTTQTAGAGVWSAIRGKRGRVFAILSVIGVLATASIVASPSSASATTYPSWSDVVAARANQAAAAAAVAQINALIAQLDAQVQSTQADVVAKGNASQIAEQNYFDANAKYQSLKSQADAAEAAAKKSESQVGQYAAQMARSGSQSGGVTLNLLLNGSSAGNLLDSLGTASQASQRANNVYKKAILDKNTAQGETDQADAQAKILEQKKQEAATAFAAAQQAAQAAQDALAAQTDHEAALKLQLAAITTQTQLTEADYAAGVAAAAAAAAAAGRGPAGVVNSQGWAKPTVGVITAGYGYRNDPAAGGAWRLHTGTDLAHGCNQPIYAAHSGTVVYAGPNGTLGNWILIDDGDGIQTGYGHIVNGGTLVRLNQHVDAGQNIARTGETGGATGCHLHFETRVNGVPTNAVPFMQARGITLG
jgi:murein DD-endopeptidase MepM/ murein hydrolase activator NlpD